jgi:hypothetical protein
MMLPMSFPDKKAAFVAVFIFRFDIGLVLGCVTFPSWRGWAVGLLLGLPRDADHKGLRVNSNHRCNCLRHGRSYRSDLSTKNFLHLVEFMLNFAPSEKFQLPTFARFGLSSKSSLYFLD